MKFADDTKEEDSVNTEKNWNIIQGELNDLES